MTFIKYFSPLKIKSRGWNLVFLALVFFVTGCGSEDIPKPPTVPQVFKLKNGYTILNGGDDVIHYVDQFKAVIKKAVADTESCSYLDPTQIEELKIILDQIDLIIISKDSLYPYQRNFPAGTSITHEIRINGVKRPFANVPVQTDVLVPELIVDLEMFPKVFQKKRLLLHEVFGLLGWESTDIYNLSAKYFNQLNAGHCLGTETPSPPPTGVQKGCGARSLELSQFDLSQVQTDKLTKAIGLFEQSTQCLVFWDSQKMKRQDNWALSFHGEDKVTDIYLHAGKLYFYQQKLGWSVLNYENDVPTSEEIRSTLFSPTQGKFWNLGSHFYFTNASEEILYNQNAEVLQSWSLPEPDPIVFAAPHIDYEHPEDPNVVSILRSSGHYSELHIATKDSNIKTEFKNEKLIPQFLMKPPYYMSFITGHMRNKNRINLLSLAEFMEIYSKEKSTPHFKNEDQALHWLKVKIQEELQQQPEIQIRKALSIKDYPLTFYFRSLDSDSEKYFVSKPYKIPFEFHIKIPIELLFFKSQLKSTNPEDFKELASYVGEDLALEYSDFLWKGLSYRNQILNSEVQSRSAIPYEVQLLPDQNYVISIFKSLIKEAENNISIQYIPLIKSEAEGSALSCTLLNNDCHLKSKVIDENSKELKAQDKRL